MVVRPRAAAMAANIAVSVGEPNRTLRSIREPAGAMLVALVFAALVTSHFDFIPFWDAKAYLYCVEEAV